MKEFSVESPVIQLRTVPTLDTYKAVKLEDNVPAQKNLEIDDSPQVGTQIDLILCNLISYNTKFLTSEI